MPLTKESSDLMELSSCVTIACAFMRAMTFFTCKAWLGSLASFLGMPCLIAHWTSFSCVLVVGTTVGAALAREAAPVPVFARAYVCSRVAALASAGVCMVSDSACCEDEDEDEDGAAVSVSSACATAEISFIICAAGLSSVCQLLVPPRSFDICVAADGVLTFLTTFTADWIVGTVVCVGDDLLWVVLFAVISRVVGVALFGLVCLTAACTSLLAAIIVFGDALFACFFESSTTFASIVGPALSDFADFTTSFGVVCLFILSTWLSRVSSSCFSIESSSRLLLA
mmetsp:Transcript_37659/g.55305  ORF Transcript_37659/g.55305 Transcript_37659/m.55305 type:complete len:284 (-) Transcript_37659:176-1027(-)